MRINTQRFGTLQLDQEQVFLFPAGLVGMESLRDWALLPDLENPSVAWLQNCSRGDRAIPMISPRAFFPDYRVQVPRRELSSLQLKPNAELYVFTTLAGHSSEMSTNLRAPILVNLSRRLGCQVVIDENLPLRQSVPTSHSLQPASVSAGTLVRPASNNPAQGHAKRGLPTRKAA